MVSIDFFTVPTISMKVLFVFFVLEHRRREVLHFGVTDHPTAAWTVREGRLFVHLSDQGDEYAEWEGGQSGEAVAEDRPLIYIADRPTTFHCPGPSRYPLCHPCHPLCYLSSHLTR